MKQRDYWDYLYDIKDAINTVQNFVEGMDKSSFANDLKTIYAVRKALEIIGEAAKNVPQEFKDKYPEIPMIKKENELRANKEVLPPASFKFHL